MSGRWTIFFENPNMTAAVIAEVGVLLSVLCGRVRGVLGVFLAVFAAGSAVALAATGSRGGLVAFLVGVGIASVAVLRGRRGARRGFAAVLLPLAALVVAVAVFDFGGRIGKAVRGQDASVGNRLVIWRTVPRMMADAPGGWGVGNSGQAFMNWYQPLDRTERYRTLVGSHFTWMVEFGGCGRFLYVFGWLLVLTLAFRRWRRTGDALPTALWLTLAVAAVPTSVLEEWAVWVLPACASLPLLVDWRRDEGLSVGALVVLAVVAATPVELIRLAQPGAVRCRAKGRLVEYNPTGAGEVVEWIVPDDAVVGADFPRRLRTRGVAMGVAKDPGLVPDEARRIVMCGSSERLWTERFRSLEELLYLSPRFRPFAIGADGGHGPRVRIVVGEFSSSALDAPSGVEVFAGASDFIPEAVWRCE